MKKWQPSDDRDGIKAGDAVLPVGPRHGPGGFGGVVVAVDRDAGTAVIDFGPLYGRYTLRLSGLTRRE